MKKILLLICCVFMLCGCSKKEDKSMIEDLEKKILNSQNYQMVADLDIYRNEEIFSYNVVSTYQKNENFKVELTNKKNNHKQIILKKSDLVYVFTPALNKSFKFQSDWPYNNSQIYLLQPIISDLKKDENLIFEKKDNHYIFTSSVNYSNEKKLKKQNVYFDKNKEISKVEVVDDDNEVRMVLNVISIEYDKKIEENFFDPNEYKSENLDNKESLNSEGTFNLDEFVYPMYVPVETYLTSQDVIETDNGDRVILTFSGESQFVFIQESLSTKEQEKYIYGDPYLILDTIGSISDKSVSWISNGVEYSVISDTMSIDELISVAQSIGVEPVGK